MLRFLALVLVLAGGAAAAIYETRGYWLPSALNARGQIDIEILKLLPAALAAIGASVVAAGTAVINVGLQLSASKRLESHRIAEQLKASKDLADKGKEISEALDKNKNDFLRELEDHKNDLARDLDNDKQQLSLQLALKKVEIERQLAQMTKAEETATAYRYAIGQIRFGEYYPTELAELGRKIVEVRDALPKDNPLYIPWCWFHQYGLNLTLLAGGRKSASRRRALWHEADPKSGNSYGREFAAQAEEVRLLISRRRSEILEEAGA